jgi:hypothetical protein
MLRNANKHDKLCARYLNKALIMKNTRQLFPLGKAYGSAFCNRIEETNKLVGHIHSCKHSLLIAPRRYGKSSLAEKAIEQAQLPSIKINFHLCTNEAEVAQIIIDAVVKLIGSAIGQIEKTILSIKTHLSNLEPLISFGNDIASLKLIPKREANYSVMITEALLLIEKLLREKNKRAVIFFDEFQEIDKISKTHAIEGAIRTAAQEMQQLTFIFSGSIRSLLLSMFENENRPLYKLCRKIKLERISAEDYRKHIQAISHATWTQELTPETFEKIMLLTNRHPYYVNYLCDTLWGSCKALPKTLDVEQAWHEVVMEEWSDALRELSDLPLGQRRLLKHIANFDVEYIQSQEVSRKLSMPPSSIATAMGVLVEKDYLELDTDKRYRVINPLLLAVVRGEED